MPVYDQLFNAYYFFHVTPKNLNLYVISKLSQDLTASYTQRTQLELCFDFSITNLEQPWINLLHWKLFLTAETG